MSDERPSILREWRIPLAIDAGVIFTVIAMAVTMWNRQEDNLERLVRVEAQLLERSAAQSRTAEQLARIETAQLFMTQDIQEIKDAVSGRQRR